MINFWALPKGHGICWTLDTLCLMYSWQHEEVGITVSILKRRWLSQTENMCFTHVLIGSSSKYRRWTRLESLNLIFLLLQNFALCVFDAEMLAHGLLWLPDLPLEYAGLDMVSKQQKNSNHAIVLWMGMPFWSRVRGVAVLLFHLGSLWCCSGLRDVRKDELGTGLDRQEGTLHSNIYGRLSWCPAVEKQRLTRWTGPLSPRAWKGWVNKYKTAQSTWPYRAQPGQPMTWLPWERVSTTERWRMRNSELEEEGLKSGSSKARNVNKGPRSESGPF